MRRPDKQGGVVSVELAYILIVLILMMAPLVLFGRALWYYGAVKSASLHGARILATAPYQIYLVSSSRNAMVTLAANRVVEAAIASGVPVSALPVSGVTILCDSANCGVSTPPQRITVSVVFGFGDNLLPDFIGNYLSGGSFEMSVEADLAYSGARPLNALGAP
jgi:hypothetical protein